jgi:hypothetical protein
LAAIVVWNVIDADWSSAVVFAVMFVFAVWREMPDRMISVLAAIGLAAVATEVLTSDLPPWAIVALAVGAPLLFGAILLVVVSRLAKRASPPPAG